jgi:hypothetical protein
VRNNENNFTRNTNKTTEFKPLRAESKTRYLREKNPKYKIN